VPCPIVFAGALALALGACGSTGPQGPSHRPAAPSHTPGPAGLDWSTATAVERPEGMDAAPPSIPPVGSGGGLGHPGHFSGQGNLYDVVATGDRLVAVGYTYPGFRGATWTSTDRQAWSLAELPGPDEPTIPTAIDRSPDGPVVAVGRIGPRAGVWRSDDGTAWTPVDGGEAFVEPPETRMTGIVTRGDGFLAGGWSGLFNGPGRARFWTSPDGRSWTRLPDDPAFADGRVTALAGGRTGFVAVGTTGSWGHATGGAAWWSADGTSWTRITDPALADGELLAVSPHGPGYVAVGASLDGTAALVWLSPDGRTWKRAPTQESLTYHGLGITMSDVVAGASGELVAVGHFLFGSQYGQGTAWTSAHGDTWTRMSDAAAFGQGEPLAVIPDGGGYVAVGTVGAPDNFIPTVWLSPSR
jgi:hypothetical protein